jgi:NAD(P)-dependent dehydrogenase (short-subunit alcohol dehydrogenase family)
VISPAPSSSRPSTALVTGASRGIGAAVARRLDADGVRVALAARDKDALEAVAAQLTHDPVVLPVDLALPEAPHELADAATHALGQVDVLVNNAGISGSIGPSGTLTAAAVDEVFAVNVRSALLLSGVLGAAMAQRGGGAIVTVSSAVSTTGTAWTAAYTATKAALDGLTRSLAAEFGAGGVRVNTVRPGVVATDMGRFVTDDPQALAGYGAAVPLGRVATPEDVAEVVAFLAGPGAAYVTGQELTVDGGWGVTRRLAG